MLNDLLRVLPDSPFGLTLTTTILIKKALLLDRSQRQQIINEPDFTGLKGK
ncbi:hypothetical protein [Chitinophaga sp. CF118]|uniref:hypothetical protein n=1 Tax=Chitinophaga sp. CF118 TaxID=1884367 RepID=UPI0015A51B6A|nr:hypothetical protein [Chitinophaga sp. CF118]